MKKTDRLLLLFYRLMQGEHIKKNLFIEEYAIGKRTFDRYIEILRLTLSDSFASNQLLYNASENSYYITGLERPRLHGMEVLPLIYLLFDSKIFVKDDIAEMLHPLLKLLSPAERSVLGNAAVKLGKKYSEADNAVPLLKLLWDLQYAIDHHLAIQLHYHQESEATEEIYHPTRILCREGEFYLSIDKVDEKQNFIPLRQVDSFSIVST